MVSDTLAASQVVVFRLHVGGCPAGMTRRIIETHSSSKDHSQ